MIDNAPAQGHDQRSTLRVIRAHLQAAFNGATLSELDVILDGLPDIADRTAFYIFASLIPPLCPVEPFLELCRGYETDLAFCSTHISKRLSDPGFALENHLPIRTQGDLLQYADDVAGSIATAIVYLSVSILAMPCVRPVDALAPVIAHVHAAEGKLTRLIQPQPSNQAMRPDRLVQALSPDDPHVRLFTDARKMGRALQLVNIARDIAKDAAIGRLYIPLSSFESAKDILDILLYTPNDNNTTDTQRIYARYNLPLLDLADELRIASRDAIQQLPRTARGGMRAMVASYFEIAVAIRREEGRVDERGVKVAKWKRVWRAASGLWVG